MKITKEFLHEYSACVDGLRFVTEYKLIGLEDVEFVNKLIELNKLDWAIWLIIRVMDRKQKLAYTIFAAEQVTGIFEKKYTNDKRPRLAIESAKKVLENDTEENRAAEFPSEQSILNIWQWIEQNFVPKIKRYSDMPDKVKTEFEEFTYQWCKLSSVELFRFVQENYAPKSEYEQLKETLTHCEILLEALKAENEKLKTQLADVTHTCGVLEKRVAEVNAENEVLKQQLDKEHLTIYEKNMKQVRHLFNANYLDSIEQARKEEIKRIKEILRIAWLDFLDDECVSKTEFALINLFYNRLKDKIEPQPSKNKIRD